MDCSHVLLPLWRLLHVICSGTYSGADQRKFRDWPGQPSKAVHVRRTHDLSLFDDINVIDGKASSKPLGKPQYGGIFYGNHDFGAKYLHFNVDDVLYFFRGN